MPTLSVDTNHQSQELYYESYGEGRPIVLIHGWPLTHRAWEPQYEALIAAGWRVIAYDRRGFGDSQKPWDGYDYDILAEDLRGLLDGLGLNEAVIAGFSMGGGEVARYIGKYGSRRVSAAMLISSVTPYMLSDESNPDGADPSVFDGMKDGVRTDRFDFISQWSKNFTNSDIFSDEISESFLDFLGLQASNALPQAMLGCIDAFGTTDFRDDLKAFDVPTLIVHGTDDRICPAEICAQKAAPLVQNAQLELLKGAPHGLNVTHKDVLNQIMTDFLATL